MQALRLWNQLHPKNKTSEEDFFVGIDLNQLKHEDVTPHAKGNLQQEADQNEQGEWKVVVRKKPKKILKKAAPKPAEKPSSALKGKRKIFYLDSRSGRTYIVDSGASFHLVSRADLSDHEVSTIVALDEPIPI